MPLVNVSSQKPVFSETAMKNRHTCDPNRFALSSAILLLKVGESQ